MNKTVKIIIVFAVCLFVSGLLDAQSITWQRLYNNQNYNDNGVDVCAADSGNFFVVGYSTKAGPDGIDVYILKLKPNGDTIWTKMIGYQSNTQPFTCTSSDDGGCVLSGDRDSAFALKINKNGEIVWQKFYGDRFVTIFEINRTSDGGFIACGRIQRSNSDEGYVYKIDSSGNLQWKKIIPSLFIKYLYSITQENNNFIAAGCTSDSEISPIDGYLLKLNNTGEIVWEKKYSFMKSSTLIKRIIFRSGSYLISGSTLDSTNSFSQTFLSKSDSSGNIMNLRRITYYNNEYLQDFTITKNNKYIFSSDVDTSSGRNARVYITDSSGNVIHQKIFSISEYTLLRSILIFPLSNDIIFAGTFRLSTSTNRDIYVVRTDSTLFVKPINVKENQTLPADIKNELYQNYPNPFNNNTEILFTINEISDVSILITDILGRIIINKYLRMLNSGTYSLKLNTKDLSSGLYFYSLFVDGKILKTKSMIVLK